MKLSVIPKFLLQRAGNPLVFIIIGDISFEIVHTLDGTFVLNEGMNTLLPMSAIGNTMEIASIRISLKDKLALGS
jgi:hypothetical protein